MGLKSNREVVSGPFNVRGAEEPDWLKAAQPLTRESLRTGYSALGGDLGGLVFQPTPAAGQVWLPPGVACGLLEVANVDSGMVNYTDGSCGIAAALADPSGGWTCVGMTTSHGRVMVGDAFRQVEDDQAERIILAVVDSYRVRVGFEDGSATVDVSASIFVVPLGRGEKGYHRTRYAPARAGERYRERRTPGRFAEIEARIADGVLLAFLRDGANLSGPIMDMPAGGRMPLDQWERLDPASAPLTHDQCADRLGIPRPNRSTPDGARVGAMLDVLSKASAGERVSFTHGDRARTLASAQTLERWCEMLGIEKTRITVVMPGEVDYWVEIRVEAPAAPERTTREQVRADAFRAASEPCECSHRDPKGCKVSICVGSAWWVHHYTKDALNTNSWRFTDLEEALDKYVALVMGEGEPVTRAPSGGWVAYHPDASVRKATEDRLNAKPTALAAGQVWERSHRTYTERYTLVVYGQWNPPWFTSEENPGTTVSSADLLSSAEWRYLGTREEVAVLDRSQDPDLFPGNLILQYSKHSDGRRTITSITGPGGAIAWEGSVEVPHMVSMIGVRPMWNGRALPTVDGVAVGEREAIGRVASVGPDGQCVVEMGTYRGKAEHEPADSCTFDLATGGFLDVLASTWFGFERAAGESDGALRERCRLKDQAGGGLAAKPRDPLDARAEIDALLHAEHRRGAPFLRAKTAALASLCEGSRGETLAPSSLDLRAMLVALEAYEDARPGGRALTAGERLAAEAAAHRAHSAVNPNWIGAPGPALARYERERAAG